MSSHIGFQMYRLQPCINATERNVSWFSDDVVNPMERQYRERKEDNELKNVRTVWCGDREWTPQTSTPLLKTFSTTASLHNNNLLRNTIHLTTHTFNEITILFLFHAKRINQSHFSPVNWLTTLRNP